MAKALRTFCTLFGRTLVSTYSDGCLGTAKSAAYSALLAFFPMLATAATILLHFRAVFVSQEIYNFLSEILPPGTEDLVFYYFAVRGKHPFLLPVTGMAVSVWAASGVAVSLMEGFRAVYSIPEGRPFLRQRLVAVLLVVLAVVPVLAATALVLFGVRIEEWVASWLGLLPAGVEVHGWRFLLSSIARYAIALGAIVLGAAILYFFGPNRKQRWSRVWPGAVLATWLWFGGTLIFGWYVRNIARYNVLYGSIAAVILLLVWMYVLAVIAFIGCEFNKECEKAGL
ncbi:MAG: YihY/virulence factor BrkB family protein [Bryobacteraceae bacterium]